MADKSDKSNKLKARLPRGLGDRGPAEIAATRRMLETIRTVYERYGFEPVETPAIEFTDALGKFLPDQDRPNEGVFSFQDDDEQWLSLRYDLTAPLARYVAENFDALPKPYRSYREGYVFRNEKPGPGRFRQFMQFDADTVGSASPAADAEICMMAADTMEALGLKGKYVVNLNSRKVLDGVMEAIGLDGEANAGRRLRVLRAIDKLDRLKWEGVSALLGAGRKDESGDFTTGAGLSESQIAAIKRYFELDRVWSLADASDSKSPADLSHPQRSISALQAERYADELQHPKWPGRYFSNEAVLDNFEAAVGLSQIGREGVNELREIIELVNAAGYGSKRIRINPSVVRGLEYYTGAVFEVEMADLSVFDDDAEDRKLVRFGSVGGGGRYDGLVGRFRNENAPATGFSIGVSRLSSALRAVASPPADVEDKMLGPVVVTVFDRDRLADYQRMVSALRSDGIRAELYLGNPKNFRNQLKYADKRGSPCVVIQGGDEKEKGEVQIKDLILGAEIAGLSKDRDDYLKKQAEAQFAVKESELVGAVRKVLLRRNATPTLFANLIGQEFFDLLFEVTPRTVAARISKALDHFNKAVELKGVDDEMGLIRLIAAEEELVVAIFEYLKSNAEKLPQHDDFVKKYKNHRVKLAFYPVLSQFRFILKGWFSEGMILDGLEGLGSWSARPVVVERKVAIQIINADGKVSLNQNPLATKISRNGLSDEEVIEELFKDFAKRVRDQHKMDIQEFVTARADFRNQLFYASDDGFLGMENNLNDLIADFRETFRDLLWALALLIGNVPLKSGGLVGQFISLYRRVLVESRLI
jgi:histidyl-tRNA synthetase